MKKSGSVTVSQGHGCTTREGISIILNYDQAKPFEYFDKGRKRRWMHPETSRKLEELLVMLRDKGEDETFYYIKHVVKVQGKKDKAHWK